MPIMGPTTAPAIQALFFELGAEVEGGIEVAVGRGFVFGGFMLDGVVLDGVAPIFVGLGEAVLVDTALEDADVVVAGDSRYTVCAEKLSQHPRK